MEHKDFKISKESVDKVSKLKIDSTLDLGLGKSLTDLIWEAQKEAIKEGIKANTIILSKHITKVNGFALYNGFNYMELPPMVCGLEVFASDELPDGYDFSLVEAPMTAREKLIAETRADTVRKMESLLIDEVFKVARCQLTCDEPNVTDQEVRAIIKRIAKEIIGEEDSDEKQHSQEGNL